MRFWILFYKLKTETFPELIAGPSQIYQIRTNCSKCLNDFLCLILLNSFKFPVVKVDSEGGERMLEIRLIYSSNRCEVIVEVPHLAEGQTQDFCFSLCSYCCDRCCVCEAVLFYMFQC
ncbi:hypothetical protein CEXT_20671 [Caerostris extrusa]|uniref:Uncharacterized protein n=1 Tax=Caerostris extrusa TaxID=172846 RepID=A0AAV4RBL9_CAEEX|nr:hypothetical protein CEXT_20671 [Caerostris extrusa]